VADARIEQYATLLVDYCVEVRPRMQVLLAATPFARPLYDEVIRQLALRGAYVIPRLSFSSSVMIEKTWLAEAPAELIAELPPIDRHVAEHAEAVIAIDAPENTRADAEIPTVRLGLSQEASRPLLDRISAHEIPWVLCQYPTPALAQDAGMSLGAFEDLLYRACLLDWAVEGERMRAIAARLQAAEELRVTGPGTDLRMSLAGREVRASEGRHNLPDGEVFFPPVEDSVEGEVHFSEFPAVNDGRELHGIRLRFDGGRVVEASAESDEAYLHEVLETDEGARRLGEVGIGCNPGVTRYMKNTLFDEKMNGTVHFALGQSYTDLGGRNESAIHWDIVKDLRAGGRIYADGELIQEDGAWRF